MTTGSAVPDEYATFTMQSPAFYFTRQLVQPSWQPPPSTTGSGQGVPMQLGIAGQDVGNSAHSGAAYADAVTKRSAGNHPFFWSIALMMTGIMLFGVIAHLEIKRR